jgi:hypothetical protein
VSRYVLRPTTRSSGLSFGSGTLSARNNDAAIVA